MASDDEVLERLRQKLRSAQAQALPKDELEKLKDRHDQLVANTLQGELAEAKLWSGVTGSSQRPGEASFDNISEFRQALLFVLGDKSELQGILEHENEHMTIALLEGLQARYVIQFMDVGAEDRIDFYPMVAVDFPQSMSSEEKAHKLKRIIEGPSIPSPRDRQQLGC